MLRRLAASAVAALASALHTDDLKQSFFSELQEAPVGTTAFVFDVGANDGEWSRSWAEACADAAAHGKRIELVLFEPQLVTTVYRLPVPPMEPRAHEPRTFR